MRSVLLIAAGIALALSIAGCATSRKITTREELEPTRSNHPIVVYAREDRVYMLRKYTLADSSLMGSGTMRQQGQESAFEGEIPFSDIIAIKTNSRSVMKALVIVGITAVFVAGIIELSDHHSGLGPTIGTTYHSPYSGGGSGTSCPFLYAWDGTTYRLQAEPFGVAWGRALEMTTWHLLPAARAEDGVVKLRLTNERQETHYVNSVDLFRIDLGSAPAAVLDAEGTAWPVSHPVSALHARDRSGREIGPLLAAEDGQLWECEPSSLTPGSGYEDVIELTFARPAHARTGSLIVTGINTTFSALMYQNLCRWSGDQAPALAHAVETDPRLIGELREFLRDASLMVSVWNGHE
ncbi:MAG: hypothetical protein ACRENS_11065, partial [Candidatus Eiseniibacteriota bacterium]